MNNNSVKYFQGINFWQITLDETEIENLGRATPDSTISHSSSSRIQTHVRKFNPALYAKRKSSSSCAEGRAMAQAVSRRPLTTEARGAVPGQVHVRFVVDKVALGQVFLRVVGFPLSISFPLGSVNCKTW
jgi:hypothetical protein